MNDKNLLTERVKSPYKMNKNSDRFRKCPNDGFEFMTNHRARIFCSDLCADEYHNLKKKNAEEYELMQEVENALEAPIQELEQKPISQEILLTTDEKIKQNLRILDTLEIDFEDGSHFNIDLLIDNGFDFYAFDGKGQLYNTGSQNCYFLQIRNYRIYRVEYSKVLIKKIT